MESRRYTNMLLELVDEGMYSARHVLGVALQCMSEAEVQSMCEDDFMQVGWELGDEDADEDDEIADIEDEDDAMEDAAETERWLYGEDPFGADATDYIEADNYHEQAQRVVEDPGLSEPAQVIVSDGTHMEAVSSDSPKTLSFKGCA